MRSGASLVLVVARAPDGSALACPICVQRKPRRRDQLRLDRATAHLLGLNTHRRAWIVDRLCAPSPVPPDSVPAGRVPDGLLEFVLDRRNRATVAEHWESAA